MRWRTFVLAGCCVLVATSVAQAFTATPAAMKVINEMRVVYKKVHAVRVAHTGEIFYCPLETDGWGPNPAKGCDGRARVSEEYDLSAGRVVRVLGRVTAHGRPTIRYVLSKRGWFETVQRLGCWVDLGLPFVNTLLIAYPFPGTRVKIVQDTNTWIVLDAISKEFGYREIDYVDPKTHLEPHEVELTTVGHKTYRITDRIRVLSHGSPRVPTPQCSSGVHPIG